MKIEPNAQSSFQKQNFCNSSQKLRSSSRQSFLFLSNFAWFLCFAPNIYEMVMIYRKFQKVWPKYVTYYQQNCKWKNEKWGKVQLSNFCCLILVQEWYSFKICWLWKKIKLILAKFTLFITLVKTTWRSVVDAKII